MGNLLARQRVVEKNKRYLFLGVEAAGVLCTFAFTPLIGIPLMVYGGFLGWRWFQYRAKNGMRF
jgi:hypothetical protein